MLTWVDIIWFLRVLGWLRYGCLCLGVCGLFGVRCCWFDCGWVVCGFDCLTGLGWLYGVSLWISACFGCGRCGGFWLVAG